MEKWTVTGRYAKKQKVMRWLECFSNSAECKALYKYETWHITAPRRWNRAEEAWMQSSDMEESVWNPETQQNIKAKS
ncbi:hypothetical protein PMZ80_007601 [Knufia obscura]|uniref:Uncharacterized protein n=2 Tax=Knufia TaxID=430999 RepID=A0AAN8EF32_9EURO|nr:hypothetical protein PMZ80_007601 [Knufia obscura]KAK5954144.1 hypothetical protein OHC33_004716 [Knufia fluminis]